MKNLNANNGAHGVNNNPANLNNMPNTCCAANNCANNDETAGAANNSTT